MSSQICLNMKGLSLGTVLGAFHVCRPFPRFRRVCIINPILQMSKLIVKGPVLSPVPDLTHLRLPAPHLLNVPQLRSFLQTGRKGGPPMTGEALHTRS